jgi:hypothetical protein
MIIDEDIDAIIQKGEEKTQALLSKYEGLNLDDLANFKSDMGAQQWEGENFSNKVCCSQKALHWSCTHHVYRCSPRATLCGSNLPSVRRLEPTPIIRWTSTTRRP